MAAADSLLDAIDLKILNLLQANARVSQADVARAVNLAPSAVLERLRKLEARGVVAGYGAYLDPAALGLGQLSFAFVRTVGSMEDMDRAGDLLAQMPEVLEVHHVAGEDCYLLKIRARDSQHLSQLLRSVSSVPGVTGTRTTIVLTTVKETPRLPLPSESKGESA